MRDWFFKMVPKITGKNSVMTPPSVIVEQMTELRPLPMGMKEFHEWSDRIIAGAMVPADPRGQKFALAEMIMHIKPSESHCNDAHFIHSLRKAASNQVAYAFMEEMRAEQKAKVEAEKLEKALQNLGGDQPAS